MEKINFEKDINDLKDYFEKQLKENKFTSEIEKQSCKDELKRIKDYLNIKHSKKKKKMKYIPSIKELKELGFELDDGDHYIAEVTTNDIYGITFPCLVNYFKDKNVFLMGVAFYFLPDSFEDLKVIMRIFGKNVNDYKHKNNKL